MSKINLDTLLKFFPEVELPVTISDDYIHTFSENNDPLPQAVIDEFILRWEGTDEVSEFTEFIPCLKIPATDDFHAIVYWRGDLLKYEFILVTMDKSGLLINRKSIASTLSNNETVRKSVAKIDEDLIIHIIAGESEAGVPYNPDNSLGFTMEIVPTGDIIFSIEE